MSTASDTASRVSSDDRGLDFRAVFEGLPGNYLVLAPDAPRFTMLAASDERLAATLRTRDQIVGQPLFSVFADANPENLEPSGVANLRSSLETVLRTGAPHRMEVQRYDLQRPDGTWEVRYWAPDNVPILGDEGTVRYIVHHVEDVTERVLEREAMEAAERAAAELRAVLESISDAVYIGGSAGITLANAAALDQLGYATREQLNRGIGTLAEEILTRDAVTGAFIPPADQAFARALRGEHVVQDVIVRHRGTGEDRIVRCAAAPVLVDGQVIAAVAVNSDVTESRALLAERERLLEMESAARREAEAASRAKGEFLAVMSHELRTPLNAIGGYAELIEMGVHGPVTAEQRAALVRIQKSQRALLSVINEVLNYARLETGVVTFELTDVPVAEAVSAAEMLVAPQFRAKGIAWSGCDSTLAVRADRDKLQQILLNLLSNAVKFTEPRDGQPGRVEVTCTADDAGMVAIQVHDTGIGIAPDKLESVFEPFVQVDARLTRVHQGTGLGLAISRDLARGMGGDLTVESTPGVGSTFTLTLDAP